MLKLATPDEMRQVDRAAAEGYGVSGLALMENAGAAVARIAFQVAMRAARRRGARACEPCVCIFAGRGNNGGDGFVAARHLAGFGARVAVYVVGDSSQVEGDARINLDAMLKSGIQAASLSDDTAWALAREDLAAADAAIDAILGTGAQGAPLPEAARAISLMNELPVPVVAVDIPSGVDALTGATPGAYVMAHTTVTLAAPKVGLLTYPGAACVGRLILDRIGMPPALIESSAIRASLTTPDDVRAALPGRWPNAHKGDFGRLLIVAGSAGMSGAASLAAMGALRSGVGLVHLCVPAQIAAPVSARHAEVMVHAMDTEQGSEAAVSTVLEMADKCQAVVVGPGMGRLERTSAIVNALIERSHVPLVLDADAINVMAGRPKAVRRASAETVLTPHPGELGRLLGIGTDRINQDRLGWAGRASEETGATVVLKGARTVIADPRGEVHVNPTGNPGMATAGMGDVLAGVAGSLCAQGLGGFASGWCATYIHGLAGDLAARERGIDGIIAGDVLEHIPAALRSVREQTTMLWAMMPMKFSHVLEGR